MTKIAALTLTSLLLAGLKLSGCLDWPWIYVATPAWAALFMGLRLWLKAALTRG